MRPAPALRVRLLIAGEVVAEDWLDAATPARVIGDRHAAATTAAHAAGRSWLVEVFNPDAPPEAAYLRFGTDRSAMTDPQPLDAAGFAGLIPPGVPDADPA